jgi:hypothetical protein
VVHPPVEELKKVQVTFENPNVSRKASAKKKRTNFKKKVDKFSEKMIEQSLEAQGVDKSTAKKLTTGTYYEGPPIGQAVVEGDLRDLMYNAQICTLHMIARYPDLVYDPTKTVADKLITPTEIAAYLVFAGLCHMRKHGNLKGKLANDAVGFQDDFLVPTPFAKYLEYALRYEGPPSLVTIFTIDDDLLLSTRQINAPGGSHNDISYLQIYNNVENHNAVTFPVVAGAGDTVIAAGGFTPSYDGLLTGGRNFAGSDFCSSFSELLEEIDVIESVGFHTIPSSAPDGSAWCIPYGPSGSTNWTQYNGVMSATNEFDVDITIICRPNLDTSLNVILPFPLGYQDCVPRPAAPAYSSVTVPLNTQGSVLTQQFDWFYWNGVRNQFNPGKWRGRYGWRLRCGLKIPRFFKVVDKQVDTYGMSRMANVGLTMYAATALNGSLITDDYIDSHQQLFETLLLAKVFKTGNWNLQGAIGANTVLSVQQLLPNMSVNGVSVPLYMKAIIDQAGVVKCGGAIQIPQICVNAAGTLASGSGIAWGNWPKFGSVLSAAAPLVSNNRYIADAQASIAFPFVPMNSPVSGSSGVQSVNSSAQVPAGGGEFIAPQAPSTATGLYISTGIKFTALNNLNLQAFPEPNVGTYNANFVMWQGVMTGIAQYVTSLFTTSQINNRGATGDLNNEEAFGGPGMLCLQIMAKRTDPGTQKYGYLHYSVTQNAVVEPTNSSIFSPWVPVRVDHFAPLNPVDHGIALGLPICSIYKEDATLFPMVTAYGEIPLNSLGNNATDAASKMLTDIDGPIVNQYKRDSQINHQGDISILRKVPYRVNKDCLWKGLREMGERISGQFAAVDWYKVTKKTCQYGVKAAGVGFLTPACSLVPRIVKTYKSIRTNYEKSGKEHKSQTPLLINASH